MNAPYPILFNALPQMSRLFQRGETGFYVDFTNRLSLFTTAAGSTNVAANDDPIGRAEDQSSLGNNATQTTAGSRPFWQSAAPQSAFFDAFDDHLLTAVNPSAAMTIAFSGRADAAASTAFGIGGGASAGDLRVFVGTAGAGLPVGGWGSLSVSNIQYTGAGDTRGADHVYVLAADASTFELWFDGALVDSGAASGTPSGSTSPMAIGAYNNTGAPQNHWDGFIYGGLCIDRKCSPSEIANIITPNLKRLYNG